MRAMGVGELNAVGFMSGLYFALLLFGATCAFVLSLSFLPDIIIEPHKFGLLFSMGSTLVLVAVATRRGRAEFVAWSCSPAELPSTAIFCVALGGTMLGALTQSYISTIFFGAAQLLLLVARGEDLLFSGDERQERRAGAAAYVPRQCNTFLRTKSHGSAYSSKFESLDYDEVHSELGQKRAHAGVRVHGIAGGTLGRWVLTAACGILIGIVAFVMMESIEVINEWKMLQLTSRIKVEFMIETHGDESVALADADIMGAEAEETLMDAMNFKYDRYCSLIRDKLECGELNSGDDRCYWDDEHEESVVSTNLTGRCLEDKVCCVEKAGSPVIFFFAVNTGLALLACLPVIFYSPPAAGSGIPEVMGYLNGVHIRKVLGIRTLLVKIWGTVMIVAAGLAVGPEGPLVHSGAIIGSLLTRGHKIFATEEQLATARASSPRAGSRAARNQGRRQRSLGILGVFDNDADRRDFISMGAAAGFAAAFGAPVGGVLFALEEASSFWNAKLMWRLMLCTSLACFTLSFMRNFEDGVFQFEPGMLTLNTGGYVLRFTHQWELLLCCVLGGMCGFIGAVFNKLVAASAAFRPKPAEAIGAMETTGAVEALREIASTLRQHSARILEVLTISWLTSLVTFGLPWLGAYYGFACQVESDEVRHSENVTSVDFDTYPFFCETTYDAIKGNHCAERGCKQYNDMATIFLSSRENSILSLVEHPQAFSTMSLLAISISFFFLMIISFGAAIPGGIFMPTIVVGCTFGALFGRGAKYMSCMLDQIEGGCMQHDPFGQSEHGGSGMRLDDVAFSPHLKNVIQHTGPYALMGGVGLLSGIQRSSVSLVVIIVEGTGKVDYLLPIIFTTVCAKWVGDKLNDGIYHTMHRVKGIPFLENEPSGLLLAASLSAKELMHADPVVVAMQARVGDVRGLLDAVSRPLFTQINAFPVVKEVEIGGVTLRVYQGIVLLSQITALLRAKRFYRRNPNGSLERVHAGASNGGFRGEGASHEGGENVPMLQWSGVDDVSDSDVDVDESNGGNIEMQELGQGSATPTRPSRSVEETLAKLEPDDLDLYLNIGEAMNTAPYHVLSTTPAHKVHRLFRTMGLRHLVVTSEVNEVLGIITRADLIHHHHAGEGMDFH